MGDFAGGLLLARELIPPGSTVLCAVSAGGSEGMFLKINTWGEEAFLDKLRDLLLD